jgi:nucleoside-diphosphate-sugar epimerase
VRRTIRAVARILIVGGGCRGLWLTRELSAAGHLVRVTTRTEQRRTAIEASGGECWIGTPDRLATLRGALEGVTLACWLLGSASGSEQELRALHGPRLNAFMRQLIDTTVRGFIYEAGGTAPATDPEAGEPLARALAEHNAIPMVAIQVAGADADAWRLDARRAVRSVLQGAARDASSA